jgi:hypothetical protein
MHIRHRIGFGRKGIAEDTLDRLQIQYEVTEDSVGYILVFEIVEDDPRWPEVERLVEEKQPSNFVWTEFTDEEVLAAAWCHIIPLKSLGYPQPERDWGYREITHERYCSRCDIDFQQVAPLRIKKEPRLGVQTFVTLNRTEPLLAKRAAIERMEAEGIRGFEVWPVMLHRADRPSEVVAQIVPTRVAGPGLAPENRIKPETCPECEVTRYGHHKRGPLRLSAAALHPDVDIQLTDEWFGSIRMITNRYHIISNRLVRLIMAEKWKGAVLWPVELV